MKRGILLEKKHDRPDVCKKEICLPWRKTDRELGMGSWDGTEVCFFCGRPVRKEKEMILIALKQAGKSHLSCTAEKREKNNVNNLCVVRNRLSGRKRLDKESEGTVAVDE